VPLQPVEKLYLPNTTIVSPMTYEKVTVAMTREELATIAASLGIAVSVNKKIMASRINARRAADAGVEFVQGDEMRRVNARVFN